MNKSQEASVKITSNCLDDGLIQAVLDMDKAVSCVQGRGRGGGGDDRLNWTTYFL